MFIEKSQGKIYNQFRGFLIMINNGIIDNKDIYFSKRVEIFFCIISVFLLINGTLFVAFSNNFIPSLYSFLSQKVFHRDFNIEKWLPSLQSFFLIPVLLIIFVNAILFYRHSDRYKIILLSSLLVCIAFFVCYTVYVSMPNFIEGDLASETLLARECVREKSLVPRGWCYSTEIRLLNTQLISAPLFLFIRSWNLVRSLTSLISSIILAWSCWFLLSRVEIKKTWMKLLGAALISCPWSALHFYVIGWGNYYIPHIVLGMITLSVFIPLLTGKSNNTKRDIIVFYSLSFISGLSTIRYILIYLFPLFLALIILSFSKEDFDIIVENPSCSGIKSLLLKKKPLLIGFIGLVFSGFGYVFNNVVLHSLYNFSQWNDVKFNFFGDVTLGKLISTIVKAFGYQEDVAVLTPGGVINIFVYCALVIFIICMYKALRCNISLEKRLVLVFTLCTIGFNSFLYYHTEFIGRFYITILAYMIPCLIIFLDDLDLHSFLRYTAGLLFSICIFTSSYTAVQFYLTSNPNKTIQPAMKFLKQKVVSDPDYSFGYSIFDFANMITYFTNEKIEVACVKKINKDGKDMLPSKYTPSTWLTPLRYNTYEHNGKVFFFTSEEIYKASPESIFEAGKEVYSDGNYRIYEYPNQDAFKKSFL